MSNWKTEDEKLSVLARGARARVQAKVGAALRDETGRTYASAEISVGALSLTAIEMVVAQAAASGSSGLESVAISVLQDFILSDSDISLISAFAGDGIPIYVIDDAGNVVDSRIT